jgi:hypothetical protein
LVLKAQVHSTKIPEQDGLKMLLGSARRAGVWYLKHLWLEAGYEGRGKRRWAQEGMGLRVEEVVRKPQKPVPEKVAMISGPKSGPRRARRR